MARPKRVRKVSFEPISKRFMSEAKNSEDVILTLEEFESIRLMDYLCLTHDEASNMLDVSRTTVTEIYDQARKKIAKALAEGKNLIIKGGDYEYVSPFEEASNSSVTQGGNIMRIAVTYEDGLVFGHFGKTKAFKIYDVEGKNIVKSEVVDTDGEGHGALATFLQARNVDVLICGGIGGGAINCMADAKIQVIMGVSGEADKAVADYLNECLVTDPNATCHHHEGENHEYHCNDHEHHEHHHEHNHECHCHDNK